MVMPMWTMVPNHRSEQTDLNNVNTWIKIKSSSFPLIDFTSVLTISSMWTHIYASDHNKESKSSIMC
jgi:hypothetical protein